MTGTVSIIVPVYNAGNYLFRSLESLIGQTYANLEIIIVDDGSTDGSREAIESFASRDERIQAVFQPNRGVSAARNAGLELATGDYVGFLDADDWLEPGTYSLVVEEFARTNIDFVTFNYFVDTEHDSTVRRSLQRSPGLQDCTEGVRTALATPNRFVFSRVWKSQIIESIRFRENLHWGEDTVFVVEAAQRARGSSLLTTPLYHYVQSRDSATRSSVNPKRLSGLEMTDILDQLLREDHEDLRDLVLARRVDIAGVLAQDVHAHPEAMPRQMARVLSRRLRRDWLRIVKSRRFSAKTKVKASIIALSPTMFARVHHASLALRPRRQWFKRELTDDARPPSVTSARRLWRSRVREAAPANCQEERLRP